MYRKPKGNDLNKRYKDTMYTYLEFIHLIKDIDLPEKDNMCIKDYTLQQFHCYVARREEETRPHIAKILNSKKIKKWE